MRILQLTAGAGGMYCGSCLRDNALAARAHGARPRRRRCCPSTRRPDRRGERQRRAACSSAAISVYLEQHVPLLRHTPAVLDWLWDSAGGHPARPRAAASPSTRRTLGELTVSMLRGEEGFQAQGGAQARRAGSRASRRSTSIGPAHSLLHRPGAAAQARAAAGPSSARCRARTCSWTAWASPTAQQSPRP